MVAVAVIGSAAIGAGTTAISSANAANSQKSAASQATQAQEAMFNQGLGIGQQNLSDVSNLSQQDLNMLTGVGLGNYGAATSNANTMYGNSVSANNTAYNNAANSLNPYISAGNSAESQLMSQLPSLTAPINMDEATLEATPGYQFTLNQGLQSVQNSAAAQGLASSGSALKGAAQYATGLADTTYQQQFNNALANKNFALSAYGVPINAGESAASSLGGVAANAAGNITGAGETDTNAYNTAGANLNALLGSGVGSSLGAVGSAANTLTGSALGGAVNTGSNIGSNITGAGNAGAASSVATGNAVSSGISNVGNLYLTNALMQGMYGSSNPLNLPGAGSGSSGGSVGSTQQQQI